MARKSVVVEKSNPTPKQLPLKYQKLVFIKLDGFTQQDSMFTIYVDD